MQEKLLMQICHQIEEISTMVVKRQKQQKSTGKKGRPSKEHIVKQYRKKYPKGRKMECAKKTGLSIKTVSKYWELYEM